MMNIGESMRHVREDCGYSLKQVEHYTGVDNGNLSRYERNINYPNIEICVRLSNFYGVSLDELVGLTDDFGSVVMPSSTVPQLSAEDKKLITAYHELDRSLQSLLWDMIKTWQKNSAPSSEEAPKKKA